MSAISLVRLVALAMRAVMDLVLPLMGIVMSISPVLLILLTFPWIQSETLTKTARRVHFRACQAVLLKLMTLAGLGLNLPVGICNLGATSIKNERRFSAQKSFRKIVLDPF